MIAFTKLRVSVGTLVLIAAALYFALGYRKQQSENAACQKELQAVVDNWGPILNMKNPLKP